ncbi:MAG: PAS domain S-box protein, partial [Candidatus Zixiibacteriota bacterium]
MKKDKKVSERADVPPKRGEAEEEGTDKLLQTLLDHTHMLVAYLDPKFNFVRVNRAYAKADERDPSFFSGKNHFDLYPDAENEGIFKEVVKTGKPYFAYAKPFEYAEHPERGVSYWDWSLIPTKVPSGAVAGLVLTLVNVTERKLAEEALRKARDELEIRVEERTRELSAANIELKEEVAERQRAEEKLRASEEKYKTLVETSRDMIFTVDLKGNFLFTNQAFGKILGYSAEEIGSLNGFDLVHPEDSKTVAQQFARLVEGESVDNMEYRYRRKEGSYITILNSAAPVFDTDENVAAAFGVARDITQRKQAEKALQESELWMRNMFNSLEEAVLVVTPDRALVNINQAAQKMFGYEKDELVDLSTEVLHVDHEHYVEFGRRIQEAFDREEPASFEFEVKRKNGEIFPSQHTVTLLKNDIGESLGIVSVVRDVTERRRAERELNQYREHLEELVEERTAELKRANERLAREVTERKRAQEALRAEKEFTERALNAQTDTFFVFEPSTRRAVRWNKTFNKTSGYSDEEIRSMKAPDSYYGEEDLKKAAAAAEKILREGVATVELSLITKDGRSIPTEYTGSAITDDEGNPKYIIAVGRDVTDRKRAEQELHKRTYDLNERVKELN